MTVPAGAQGGQRLRLRGQGGSVAVAGAVISTSG